MIPSAATLRSAGLPSGKPAASAAAPAAETGPAFGALVDAEVDQAPRVDGSVRRLLASVRGTGDEAVDSAPSDVKQTGETIDAPYVAEVFGPGVALPTVIHLSSPGDGRILQDSTLVRDGMPLLNPDRVDVASAAPPSMDKGIRQSGDITPSSGESQAWATPWVASAGSETSSSLPLPPGPATVADPTDADPQTTHHRVPAAGTPADLASAATAPDRDAVLLVSAIPPSLPAAAADLVSVARTSSGEMAASTLETGEARRPRFSSPVNLQPLVSGEEGTGAPQTGASSPSGHLSAPRSAARSALAEGHVTPTLETLDLGAPAESLADSRPTEPTQESPAPRAPASVAAAVAVGRLAAWAVQQVNQADEVTTPSDDVLQASVVAYEKQHSQLENGALFDSNSGEHPRREGRPSAHATLRAVTVEQRAPNFDMALEGSGTASNIRALAGSIANETANTTSIVRAIHLQSRHGVGTAVVNLAPEYLGAVTITLLVVDGGVSATVHADNAEVRSWLALTEPTLRQGLADHGLALEQLLVSDERPPDEPGPGDGRRRRNEPDQHEVVKRPSRPDPSRTFDVVV